MTFMVSYHGLEPWTSNVEIVHSLPICYKFTNETFVKIRHKFKWARW